MKFLRKAALFILVAVPMAIFGYGMLQKVQPEIREYITPAKPCRTPLKYSVGPVDQNFSITEEQLKIIAEQSASVWDKAAGFDLFEYVPDAQIRIRMVYDERQQGTIEAETLEGELQKIEAQQSNLKDQYGVLNKEYADKLAKFETAVSRYEKKLKEYVEDVEYWNEKGGAPPEKYEELEEEQDDLNDEHDKLKKQEKELNELSANLNKIASKESNIVREYNSEVVTFAKKYGGAQEFEKGVFDPQQGIIIYQFRELADLQLTLTHELGHALGMDHVSNPKSAMYYMIGEQDLENQVLTSEDLAELKSVCQL